MIIILHHRKFYFIVTIHFVFFYFRTCGESSAVLYYNNMACLHLAMGKPNLACFYLRKALHENKCALESIQVKDNGNYN